MRFFIAGIMQGSFVGPDLHDQSYRRRVRELLEEHFEGAKVFDPFEGHSDSITYDDDRARAVFYNHNRICGQVDVLIALVPEASMGTAVEMWEAYRNGRIVVCVSPLVLNWAVRYLSHIHYETEEALVAAIESDELARRIEEVKQTAQPLSMELDEDPFEN